MERKGGITYEQYRKLGEQEQPTAQDPNAEDTRCDRQPPRRETRERASADVRTVLSLTAPRSLILSEAGFSVALRCAERGISEAARKQERLGRREESGWVSRDHRMLNGEFVGTVQEHALSIRSFHLHFSDSNVQRLVLDVLS